MTKVLPHGEKTVAIITIEYGKFPATGPNLCEETVDNGERVH